MATTTVTVGTSQDAEARLDALLKTAEELSDRLSTLKLPSPPSPPPAGAATPATDATSNRLLLLALASMPSSHLLLTHPDYYSWPLEARRDHLGASAVSCLCKSILLVNTRCTREDCEDPRNPKHLMVVVPYGRKLNTQEVLRWSKARAPAGISGKNFNWRLGDGAAVTGYEYNAVRVLSISLMQLLLCVLCAGRAAGSLCFCVCQCFLPLSMSLSDTFFTWSLCLCGTICPRRTLLVSRLQVTPLGSQSAVPIVVDESLVAAHGGGVMFLGGGGVLVKWRVCVDEFVAWAGGAVANFSVEGAAGEE